MASPDGRVSLEDLQRAADEAKRKQAAVGKSYVHHVRMPIQLDGRSVEDPVGMRGQNVELAFWSILADESSIRMNLDIAHQYSLEVDDLILSSIASATLVAGPDLRRAGVLVIDMGAGVTDIALYRGGNIAFTGVVPVGGDHLTGDLAMGLRILSPTQKSLNSSTVKLSLTPPMPSRIYGLLEIKRLAIEQFVEKQSPTLFMFEPLNFLKLSAKSLASCSSLLSWGQVYSLLEGHQSCPVSNSLPRRFWACQSLKQIFLLGWGMNLLRQKILPF